jgi:hypothetical protein
MKENTSDFNIILDRIIKCPFSISNDPNEAHPGSYSCGDGSSYHDELGSSIFTKWYDYLIRGVLDKNNNKIVSIEKTRKELSSLFARYSESILYCMHEEDEQSKIQLLISSKIINGNVFDDDFCRKFNQELFFNPLDQKQRIENIFKEVQDDCYFWQSDCLMKEPFCKTFSQLALEYDITATIIEISECEDLFNHVSEELLEYIENIT